MATFKVANPAKRSNEYTTINAADGELATIKWLFPDLEWVPCAAADVARFDHVYTQSGVRFLGWL